MSSPIPGPDLVRIFRQAGLTVVEMPNWLTTNRNQIAPWNDVHGVTIHHTGSDTTNPYDYSLFLQRGRSDLIGPLCNYSVAYNGVVYMIGNGRANHAGKGDAVVYDRILAETMPLDGEMHPATSGSIDLNSRMYGNEVQYSGGHPMTAVQLQVTEITTAVICKEHGWNAGSVAAHREQTNQKPDPGYTLMGPFRTRTNARILGNINPGDDVGNVDTISDAAAEKIAWWILYNYKMPWVDPAHAPGTQPVISPEGHPTQTLAALVSWNEEYSRRFVQEAFVQYIPEIVKQVSTATVDVDAVANAVAAKVNAQVAAAVVNEFDKRLES